MSDLLTIFKKYVNDTNPVINKNVDGIDMPISEAERLALVEEWAIVQKDLFLSSIRAQRNSLLQNSDWTQLPNAPVDAEVWAEYRQKLRDFPDTIVSPFESIVWPTPPA